jgi:hypothetical protein
MPNFLIPVVVLEVLALMAVIWALIMLITGRGLSEEEESRSASAPRRRS